MKYLKAIALLSFCAPVAALAGPDWIERGDAGSTANNAQIVTGVGTPRSISGSLSTGLVNDDFEDLYVIYILEPDSFSFTMQATSFDSQIYLFAISPAFDMYGMLSNDDSAINSTSAAITQSFASDATGAHVVFKGLYCLAITSSGRYPVSEDGAIFYQATRTEISGPDGVGRNKRLNGWEGPGGGGSYTIELEGVGYADIPAPGVLSLFGAGCVVSLRRRR